MLPKTLVLWAIVATVANTQQVGSFPHDYPGIPNGDFSPEWQTYFEVTDPLPNVTFNVGRSWAGNIPVQREGHPNNTLFFWAFEKSNGSLTLASNDSTEPWGIWLNGGPGSSSLIGLFFENGPLHIQDDLSLRANNFSWNGLADYIWIDQPVGTGWSTADEDGFIHDEDQMGLDFFGFLENLVEVFPSLKTRPLYLTGESYAGTYIPYITKTYFSLESPPVNLAKIAIGDGTLGSTIVFEELPIVTIIETYPQLIGYDPDVYNYFKEQAHLCGYDLNLTYPQNGHFPTLQFIEPATGNMDKSLRKKKGFLSEVRARYREVHESDEENQSQKRHLLKRDLTGRANGTIDPSYGCFLYEELLDYVANFSFPWNVSQDFDVYNIPDALNPEAPMAAEGFLNDNRTRAAIHAPTSKDWQSSILYTFGNDGIDPSVEPMAFLSDLATNASLHNISVVIFSGNDDSLVSHRGSEVAIQNTTFGGIQGFSRQPSTHWFDDDGNFAGIVHQERNWTYVLFQGAGHLVSQQQPGRAFTFLREFVLGNNATGLVTNTSGFVSVIGGEDTNPTLAADVMPGQSGIFVGSGSTQSTYTYPSATIAAWESFVATALFSSSPTTPITSTATVPITSNAARRLTSKSALLGIFIVTGMMLFV